MELFDLVGEHILSGVEQGYVLNEGYAAYDAGYLQFTLDGVTYRAVENPDDGYRSHCESLEIVEEKCKVEIPPTKVLCSMAPDNGRETMDVLEFRELTSGNTVLRVGTANTDDYYPYCVFEWKPELLSHNQKETER